MKNVFRYENKAFVSHSLAFSSNKRKAKSVREVALFYLKETKMKWEAPKEENVVPI